jgi:4-diphosphocytidyl-2C-methyl-D-erythritol kinase
LSIAAEKVRPALSVLRQRVVDLGQMSVHLTGSGSTLFVACEGEAAAARCANDLSPLAVEGVRVLRTQSAMGSDAPTAVAWPSGRPDGWRED